MIGELARGGTTAGPGGDASAGTTGTGQAFTCFGRASLAIPAPGPGTQKQAAVSGFRPCTIPRALRAGNTGTRLLVDPRRKPGNSRSGLRDIDRIVNSEDWYRMIPSTTYFLSLREH